VRLPLPALRPCRVLRRAYRFLVEADVGPLHLPNSGRMGELLLPGTPGHYHPRPAPKTLGRLYLVEREGVLVGVDASLAARVLEALLKEGFFGPLEALKREAKVAGERLDFRARLGGKEAFLEAKNCNRVEGGLALFPDAPTPRGARHLRLLARLAREGYGAFAVWVVQHPLAQAFALDPEDRALLRAAREALEAGVQLLAFRARPTLEALRLEAPLPWVWLAPEEDLEGHHQGRGEGEDRGHPLGLGFSKGVAEDLGHRHPEHGPGGEAKPRGQGGLEGLHEEEGGHGHEGLGKAGEDAPQGGSRHAHPPRDQHQADGESLGDVVHGDGQGDEDP